ncbi:hypothetical protein AAMO2058_000392600 [Amorphochlora amoebiformis]
MEKFLNIFTKGVNMRENIIPKKAETLSKTHSVHHAPKVYLRGAGSFYTRMGLVAFGTASAIMVYMTPKLMTGKGRYD